MSEVKVVKRYLIFFLLTIRIEKCIRILQVRTFSHKRFLYMIFSKLSFTKLRVTKRKQKQTARF